MVDGGDEREERCKIFALDGPDDNFSIGADRESAFVDDVTAGGRVREEKRAADVGVDFEMRHNVLWNRLV